VGSGFRERADQRLLTVEEAQQSVLDCVAIADPEVVSLAEALGRWLREDVTAPFDVPERDNSAMDGYAVIASETAAAGHDSPVVLRVIEDVAAGAIAREVVVPGTATRIMTGALMPSGADAVVQVEWTDAGRDDVRIARGVERGANIRRAGEDMRRGATILTDGTWLGPGEIGALAAAQRASLRVARRLRVSILSTGNELVTIDEPRQLGQVVNSNAWSLEALVREAGGIARVHSIVRDDRAATVDALRDALADDIVISTGGVSAGAYDFVEDALADLGAETMFSRVAMKPGKPVVFSRLGDRLIFGLPGNPVSCMVAFHLFVAPAMRKACGQREGVMPPVVKATLATRVTSKGDRRTYLRARVVAADGVLVAHPKAAQGSGVSTSMTGANGLLVMETGRTSAEAGEVLPVVLIGPIASA
jgi:molybdopterin molybdotransferase